MTYELRMQGRIRTLDQLPADPGPIDVWAITDGRRYAAWLPDIPGVTPGWEIGDWNMPSGPRDTFDLELDDIQEDS